MLEEALRRFLADDERVAAYWVRPLSGAAVPTGLVVDDNAAVRDLMDGAGRRLIISDVNVIVHAWWSEPASHFPAREWLEQAVAAPEVLGISEQMLTGEVRILTHPACRT